MQYTVLENGLDFILSAIKNLSIANEASTDEVAKKRLIKYSLLHLSSGIELVFKYRLLQENWTYVFADMNKARKKALQTGELKSVDSETIIERLENLCDINLSDSDKLDLKNLRKRRNKAEHFEVNEHILSVESSIHKSISILMKFIAEHYDIEELGEEELQLFTEIKDAMRGLTKHYDDAKLLAQKELEQSGASAVICPECKEEFLVIDDNDVKCYFCGYDESGETAADDYINNVLGIDAYSTIKDGGKYPLYTCPECGDESLVYDYENGIAICFCCGHKCGTDELSFCNYCGTVFYETVDEGMGICSNCISYKINKDE